MYKKKSVDLENLERTTGTDTVLDKFFLCKLLACTRSLLLDRTNGFDTS